MAEKRSFSNLKAGKEVPGGDIRIGRQLRGAVLKEALVRELEDFFGSDARRIAHAKKVMEFAEKMLKRERADYAIVIPAAILHDVGIKPAEEKYGSAGGQLQEKEGPAVARKILRKIGMKKDRIGEICRIIASHHSPGEVNTVNFRVLYDADWLVNFGGEFKGLRRTERERLINRIFLTETGRLIASVLYLKPVLKKRRV
ncbi:MAG: HD domain-containing protein [Candidatus Omnitrophota bacterium]